MEFKPERFVEKPAKRNTFLPFSSGKRACIGKYLAELIVRINIASFLEIFEIEVEEGEEFRSCLRLLTGAQDCVMKFRPRVK